MATESVPKFPADFPHRFSRHHKRSDPYLWALANLSCRSCGVALRVSAASINRCGAAPGSACSGHQSRTRNRRDGLESPPMTSERAERRVDYSTPGHGKELMRRCKLRIKSRRARWCAVGCCSTAWVSPWISMPWIGMSGNAIRARRRRKCKTKPWRSSARWSAMGWSGWVPR
ncbi:hypothetical protein L841_5180 [Mycobacterium sp. MAC_080597_8934]|nr:hypothetical protein L839_2511 [Mycobacterium avium MAV_120809_2495]ETZ58696.1 hypothetical protein L841_5180 [Mycobacterium sp. MAC_080597_8934]ETZ76089.1 hypothetical protein L840_0779 [Mycobacterium sp. MAC_011194_8550]